MNHNFYKSQSTYSNVNDFKQIIQDLPSNIDDICCFIQNNLIHSYWLNHYGCEIEDCTRLSEMQIRYANDILRKSELKSGLSITQEHAPKNRVVSICRDFSLLLCSILREKGTPSRIRCGFSKYLTPGKYEDHWVCEYWKESEHRWVMVDAQLDELHFRILNYEFDKNDVPSSEFLYAGKAWQLCRSKKANPEDFGIFDLNGYSFIKGNLIRDLFALIKFELMAWDTGWGILKDAQQPIESETEFQLLDKLAVYSCDSDTKGAKTAIESMEELKIPSGWSISKAPTISELLSQLG